MKQKYTLIKTNKLLKIEEYAELDKEIMSLLCKEEYTLQELDNAIKIILLVLSLKLNQPNKEYN